jgi:hypothetical protein
MLVKRAKEFASILLEASNKAYFESDKVVTRSSHWDAADGEQSIPMKVSESMTHPGTSKSARNTMYDFPNAHPGMQRFKRFVARTDWRHEHLRDFTTDF